MLEKLSSHLEKALFNMDRYGLRPSIKELEQLAKMELIDISQDDGWVISMKGSEYIKHYISTSNTSLKNSN
jgi:hypothetical protein